MNWWTTVGLVAVRELVERVKSKAFIFSTAFIPLLVVAAVVIPAVVEDDGPGTLVVVSSSPLSETVVERHGW